MKTKSFKAEMNLPKLIEQFGDDEKCRARLTELRWPKGVSCPRCQSKSISRVIDRDQYDCNACRYQFSVTSGTIFHDTHLPLTKWFLAIYLMTESKKGISALQMKRTLDIVEVDETWVGGKTQGLGRGYKGNKAIAIGAVQRHGKIRLQVIRDASKA